MLPKGKIEFFIMLSFFIFYFSYTLYLIFTTSIMDNERFHVDLFFSFDNVATYHLGFQNEEGHPLMKFFMIPLVRIGNTIALIVGHEKAKAVFMCSLFTMMISLSSVYMHRYYTQVIGITNKKTLSLLTLFYGFLSTNLILCFTTESFTITVFLLTFCTYFYSKSIKTNTNTTIAQSGILAIMLGGITITNFAKGIIPIFFTNQKRKVIIRNLCFISLIFLLLISAVLINGYSDKVSDRIEKFSFSENSRLEYIIDLFFSAPILFPELITVLMQRTNGLLEGISVGFYHHWWQYASIAIIFGLCMLGIARNYKNKLIWMLLMILSVDIAIHIIIGYGLNDPFIYGGHWVFLVPLFIGWAFKDVELDSIKGKIYSSILLSITIILMVNNTVRLFDFISLAEKLFPIDKI